MTKVAEFEIPVVIYLTVALLGVNVIAAHALIGVLWRRFGRWHQELRQYWCPAGCAGSASVSIASSITYRRGAAAAAVLTEITS